MLIKRTLPLALATLAVVQLSESAAPSQTRRRPSAPTTRTATTVQKRRVILDLQGQDQPIGADLIQADAAYVTVEIDGVRRVYKADDVIGIIYSPNEAQKKYPQIAGTPESASGLTAPLNPKDFVGVNYDAATDETMVSTNNVPVYEDRRQAIGIRALASFKGRVPKAQPLLIIVFESVSDDWQYDYYFNEFGRAKFSDILQFLVDGSPLFSDFDFRVRASNARHLGIEPIRRDTQVANGKAIENISIVFDSKEFTELAKAQRVDVQLAQRRFQISAASLEILREFLRRATAGQ